LTGRLLSFYRERKYLKASIDIGVEEKPEGGRRLTVLIVEGKAGYLKTVRFTGNANIKGERLQNQMLSTERGFFHYLTGSGKFDEGEWNDDLAALIGLYPKEGVARARISSGETEWADGGGCTG